ncbi:hypothetical protein ACFQ9Q_12245 [Streptomyces virginiae]|uniref:hypothetical protein n=1 Tax=Streptomyces virginiae TaxID=1961 RepID=UPI0036988165
MGKKLAVSSSNGIDEEFARELFAPYGEVISLSLATTDGGREIAIVEMESSEGAEQAMADLDGNNINGSFIQVTEAKRVG